MNLAARASQPGRARPSARATRGARRSRRERCGEPQARGRSRGVHRPPLPLSPLRRRCRCRRCRRRPAWGSACGSGMVAHRSAWHYRAAAVSGQAKGGYAVCSEVCEGDRHERSNAQEPYARHRARRRQAALARRDRHSTTRRRRRPWRHAPVAPKDEGIADVDRQVHRRMSSPGRWTRRLPSRRRLRTARRRSGRGRTDTSRGRCAAGRALLEFGTLLVWLLSRRAAGGRRRAARPPRVRHLKIEDGPGRPLGRSFGVKLWPDARGRERRSRDRAGRPAARRRRVAAALAGIAQAP